MCRAVFGVGRKGRRVALREVVSMVGERIICDEWRPSVADSLVGILSCNGSSEISDRSLSLFASCHEGLTSAAAFVSISTLMALWLLTLLLLVTNSITNYF